MTTGDNPAGLSLTEEEAYSILALCLTSPQGLDAVSERALRKLAEYCTSTRHSKEYLEEDNCININPKSFRQARA
jgi:hypothetical protein